MVLDPRPRKHGPGREVLTRLGRLSRGEPAEPPSQDFIMRNAMDSQEVAVGWWPGDPKYDKPAFYAYAHPAPDGFADAKLEPDAARIQCRRGMRAPKEPLRRRPVSVAKEWPSSSVAENDPG